VRLLISGNSVITQWGESDEGKSQLWCRSRLELFLRF